MPATPPVHPVPGDPDDAEGLDDAIRTLLLVMPRAVGRIKRLEIPEALREMALAPRHLSLLSFLLLDGPMTVRELADHLEVAPTTASLLVGELSRKGVLDRREDENDRRRRIVSIPDAARPALEQWLAPGARAWHAALSPLSPTERRAVVQAFTAYEAALPEADGG
ncbi:MarR family winged helix-turn-helix transcriptional regulator [Streptomyces sedi]|uniref:Winged helix-turn-helix transcriptional regulator n=1 Tax=Streptomyces sedi TaxID=555059 RepID=A0A5C4VC08_9ACTN|nr:MarR family winged helix-turn-helix transcriptional regulator [Streptomyces sedi]TNM33427.1 winged helix-turn-helix transcriptional regulator [Streptomyces sedi]